jgi:hypothetical protein
VNLLQSLVARALDTAAVVEPPRVPFVTVFPERAQAGGVAETGTPTTRGAAIAPVAARPLPSPSSAPPPPTRPPVERDALMGREPGPSGQRPLAPVPDAPAPGRRLQPRESPLERVIERWVAPPSTPVPAEPPTLPPAPATTEPGEPADRDAAEVHHHWIERRTERVVERTPPASRTTPPAPGPVVEPRPAPRILPPPPPPRVTIAPRPPVAGPAVAPAAEAAPAVHPPAVHVSIGRIVVRVQTPAEPVRTETTRPAPPTVTLEAYMAARRARDRR